MYCNDDVISEPEMNPYKYHYSLIEPHRKFKPKIHYKHITPLTIYNVMDSLNDMKSIRILKNSVDSFVDRAHIRASLNRTSVAKEKSLVLPASDKLSKNKKEKIMQEKSLLYQCLSQTSTSNEENKTSEATNLFDHKINVKESIEVETDTSVDWAEVSLKNVTSSFSKQIFDNFGLNFFGKENTDSVMTLSLTDTQNRRQISFTFDSKLSDKNMIKKQSKPESIDSMNNSMECGVKESDFNKDYVMNSSVVQSQNTKEENTDQQSPIVSS